MLTRINTTLLNRRSRARAHAAPFALAALFAVAGTAFADDRDLLREASADPLVFILFDTSGSMHWSPQCSQEDFDAGVCDYLCPSGDCFVPRNGDDPASKFRQAKEALYEVIDQVGDGIHFGFATYNQNRLRMQDKHWIYRMSDAKPDGSDNFLTLENLDRFPLDVALHCTRSGATCDTDADCGARGGECAYDDVFGASWPCSESNNNGNDRRKACFGSTSNVADMNDYWELRRAQRLPKLGRGPDFSGVRRGGSFIDHFDTDSFSGNDGSYSWSGDWIEDDHSGGDGPTLGNALISGGRLRLDDTPDNSPRPSLERQVDLSGFDAAELSFDFEVVGDIENSDDARIEVSDDGGASWTELERFDGRGSPYSGSRTYDISDYISNNTRIRFRIADEFNGPDEQFIVDDVTIRGGPEEFTVYLRNPADDRRYKFIYRAVPTLLDGTANRYGNPQIAVEIEVRECTDNNNDCDSDFVDRETIYYDLVDEYASWDNGADRGPDELGFYNQGSAADGSASGTCDGWDDNDDTDDDRYPDDSGYNLRWVNNPATPPNRFDLDGDGTPETPDFLVGDMIPLDWASTRNNRDLILGRLAPNVVTDPAATPDFRIAPYFADERLPGENFLRLEDERMRPLVSDGSTPLGNSIRDFRAWYNGCTQGNCPNSSGWEDLAIAFDRDFNCRKKYLIVLTDGDNTCDGPSACSGTASLRAQTGIRTFVVAFGVQGGGNTLICMANNGGTGDPIYPQNKEELVDALTELFNDIKVEARSFSSASVPTLTNETSDKIILSTFTPLPDQATWPGRVNTFRSPLPLLDNGTPDFGRSCNGNPPLQAACHLWDAAQVLLAQAPTPDDIAGGVYKMGGGEDERRVLYSKASPGGQAPSDLRLFLPPEADSADEEDLWAGLGLNVTLGDAASEAAARSRTQQIIDDTLKIKTVTVPDPNGGPDQEFVYVLGDIFHSEPQVVSSPNDLIYFRLDLGGYREFVDENFWRRKMLIVGANDGQLHFFDSGVRTLVFDPSLGVDVERFTDGTGKELFSYMPRLVMPIVRDQAGAERHIYSLDGVPVVADVHIDPHYDVAAGEDPDPDHREWRTVVFSGLREGGDIFRRANPVPGFVSGYFALDITQPDPLIIPAPTVLDPDPTPIPEPESGQGSPPLVPGCLSLTDDDLQGDADCATSQGELHPFPAELWIFTDSVEADVDGDGTDEVFYLDEEPSTGSGDLPGNQANDLGDTWSKPVVGRIRIGTEDRFVAIFGGGLDPSNPNTSSRGAWLYMIDVETGEAIYKRRLDSSTPAAPAVLDTDQNGYFDVVYAATTGGTVYKVDLTAPVSGLADVTIAQANLLPADPSKPVPASVTVRRVTDAAWEPFAIFSTGGRPIYMTPSAFDVPDLDQFALSFGTGNRNDLWNFTGQEGRFYVFVDEDYTPTSPGLPRTEASYARVLADDANTDQSFLLDRPAGQRGWYLVLEGDERVITQAFVLVGVMIFTSFDPQQTIVDGEDLCARSGVSRAFVVDAENANAFVSLDDADEPDRFHTAASFTTAPYVKETTTKNPGVSGNTTDSNLDPTQEALQEAIRQALMRFFPKGCKFNRSFSLTVDASLEDTGHIRYATIPVAMCPVEWREE